MAFANLYIDSQAVAHVVRDKQPLTRSSERPAGTAEDEYLADPVDAMYFSFVTMTTLGYGDYVPASRTARIYVVCQLLTTAIIILFAFPLVVSRVASY